MNEKKADNTILSKKQKINEIDDMLALEKKQAQKLENLRDNFWNLHKSMDRCVTLLSQSIKGPNIEITLSDMRDSSEKIYNKSNENINMELKRVKKRVNKLYSQKEEIIKKRNQE